MTVETTVVHRRYEVTVQVHIVGAEPRQKRYTEMTYQPTRALISYRWGSDDTEQTVRVELAGPRVLKYDALGQIKSEHLWDRERWPDWVRDLVEANRPPADAFVGSTP